MFSFILCWLCPVIKILRESTFLSENFRLFYIIIMHSTNKHSQMLKGLLLQLYTSRISINMNIHNHYPYNLINLISCKDKHYPFNSINVVACPGRSDDDLNVLYLFLHFHNMKVNMEKI